MVKLPNDYRVNHRAASESLMRAVEAEDLKTATRELDTARFFASEALKSGHSRRQRALNLGFQHAADLVEAVTAAAFGEDE